MFQNLFSNITPVVKNILIINVILFIATLVLQTKGINLNEILGAYNFQSGQFKPFQIVTHMFMHANISHIFFNMFGLIMFGPILEKVWGHQKFLIYYFSVGIGAFIFYEIIDLIYISSIKTEYGITDNIYYQLRDLSKYNLRDYQNYLNKELSKISNQNNIPGEALVSIFMKLATPMIGASGAIYGVLLAYGMYFPNTRLMLLFPPIPIKAKWFVLILGGISLFSGLKDSAGDNVAHFAHLGGMIFGFILIKIWQKDKKNFY